MDLNSWFMLLFVLAVLLLSCLLVYSGLLAKFDVSAKKSPYGPMRIAYKKHIGAYSGVGEVFQECCRLAPKSLPLGIYMDDPTVTASDCCRAAVGKILTADAKQEEAALVAHGYSIFEVPQVENIVSATFPYITRLSLYIAVIRVYPALKTYIKEKELTAHPFLEIYEGNEIHFIAPLSHQEEFYPHDLKEPVKLEKTHQADEKPLEEGELASAVAEDQEILISSSHVELDSALPEQTQTPLQNVGQTNHTLVSTEPEVVDSEQVILENSEPVKHEPSVQTSLEAVTTEREIEEAPEIKEEEPDCDMDEFEAKLEKLERELSNRTKNSMESGGDPIAEIEEHLKKSGLPLDDEPAESDGSMEQKLAEPATQQPLATSNTAEEQESTTSTDVNGEQEYQELAKDIVKNVVNDAKSFLAEEGKLTAE